eukprot:13957526-Ditylum_brightwellii.AAC.1
MASEVEDIVPSTDDGSREFIMMMLNTQENCATMGGYNLAYKYNYLYDVICHNMRDKPRFSA